MVAHAVIYQIYPRSFADSDGDGIGDLPGITGRLDHLVELGVDALWLSPFYPSPQDDAGYDVADYRDVDPLFGTLADADAMIAAAHERGLRVIVDLVPNHTSIEHRWFQAALAARATRPSAAATISATGPARTARSHPTTGRASSAVRPGPGCPTGSGTCTCSTPSQPDLNWDNPEVRAEFEDVLRFWLDRGVDGLRIDVAHGLVKAPGLPDDVGGRPPAGRSRHGSDVGPGRRARDLPVLAPDRSTRTPGASGSWSPRPGCRRRSGWPATSGPDEMHQAFNFEYLYTPWRAADQRAVIDGVVGRHGVGRRADHLGAVQSRRDPPRHPAGLRRRHRSAAWASAPATRSPTAALGLRRARAATLLMLALPGSAYLYQGEELGLPEDV